MKPMRHAILSLSASLLLFVLHAAAHTLPISYLTVVPDKNYAHIELTLNPFELNCVSEFDSNKNNLLEPAELQASDEALTARILQHINLRIGNQLLKPETAGISGEAGTHHFTLRAHYPIPDGKTAFAVESRLTEITSASHLTEVTFGRGDQQELARLDSQTKTANFGQEDKQIESTASTSNVQASTAFFVVLLLAAIPSIGVFITLLLFAPRQLREEPAHH